MPRPGSAKFGRRAEAETVYTLLAPMQLLPFNEFHYLGSIPRSDVAKTVPSTSLEGQKVCIVFISHRWLRPSMNPKQAHPDDTNNSKYQLILSAIATIKTALPSDCAVYLWIDFACIDQDDGKKKLQGIMSLPGYIERCHVTLTPLVDEKWQEWYYSLPTMIQNFWLHYPSETFQEYRSRAWCRLEAWITSNVPLPTAVNYFELVSSPSHRRDRPHLIYGSWNVGRRLVPQILPPLQHSFLDEFHPLKGKLTDPDDNNSLQEIIDKVPESVLEVGYTGDMKDGRPHGTGREVWDNGDWYEGEYSDGLRHGQGSFYYSNGEKYTGAYVHGDQTGHGEYIYGDGARYVGEYVKGFQNGLGEYHFRDGAWFKGEYVNGCQHGKGTYHFPNGAWEECIYENGQVKTVLRRS
eukprot:NODE_1724_length_1401_cov_33.896389_g1637_i0.p1 GENE.NODE_1724_length_1401_cov_33.896389_g1637_i0~~NODE_1724_length_1401_cov_33.896389_g1637_i0.p1  ORF type:complete len:407 (-),score=84.03 NODE_1724_length_1401_cov_33.896389_g1637_i0:124-1344(-)